MSGPIDGLISWLGEWFGNWQSRLKEVWDKLMTWRVAKWGVVGLVSGWFWSIINFAGSGFTPAMNQLDAISVRTIGTAPGWLSGVMALANTFVPLQEAFGMILSYITLLVALKVFHILRKTLGFLFGLS